MKTWGDARIDCQQRHRTSDLASIESADVQIFLMRKLKDIFGSYSYQQDLWIGLLLQGYGGFEWADRSPLGYINWAEGEPSAANTTRTEDCVEMYWRSGKWNDANCATKNNYVCKMPKIPGATLPPTTQAPTTSSSRFTAGPPATEGNLGPQPTARPNEVKRFFSSRKNDSLVVVILIFFIALLVLATGGIIFHRSRGGFAAASTIPTVGKVANASKEDTVKVEDKKSSDRVDLSSFENPNAAN